MFSMCLKQKNCLPNTIVKKNDGNTMPLSNRIVQITLQNDNLNLKGKLSWSFWKLFIIRPWCAPMHISEGLKVSFIRGLQEIWTNVVFGAHTKAPATLRCKIRRYRREYVLTVTSDFSSYDIFFVKLQPPPDICGILPNWLDAYDLNLGRS